jgi:hypothetical protein
MSVTDSKDQWDERVIKNSIKLVLLEIIDPNQNIVMERIVNNLVNLARRNEDLTDGMLQNLILRQIFSVCDKSKLRQVPLVSKRILDYLRRSSFTEAQKS